MELGSVALFRALHVGDLLCAVPAVRALRRSDADARITLIGLPWAASLPERYPRYLDDFIEFPGWPGIPERDMDEARMRAFLDEASRRRFDLAVQLHGEGRIANEFVETIPAAARTGFAPAGEPAPGYLPYPDDCSEVERLLRLAAHLGATDLDPALEFPLFEEERAEAAALLAAHGLTRGTRYACMHAGGRGNDRRWQPAGFAAVADVLADAGLQVVLTGTASDRPVNNEVRSHLRSPAVDLTGSTTLGVLAAVIEAAHIVVTNDSGPSHLAAALRVPSVVVFTGSDRRRWAPADAALHVPVGSGRPDGADAPAPPPTVEEVLAALPAGMRTRGAAA